MSSSIPSSISSISSISSTTPVTQFQAFEATAAERAALDPTKLRTINVDVLAAASRAEATAKAAEALEAELAVLPGGAGLIAMVKRHARGAAEAQYLYEATEQPMEDLAPSIEQLRSIRVRLLADANALVVRGLLKADQIVEVTNSNGYRAIAYDVQRLCTALRLVWSRIEGRTALTRPELDAAHALAVDVEAQVATRERNEKTRAEAGDDRQRAFTLLDMSYDRLQKLIGFVRWEIGDAATFAPSLNVNKGRRRGAGGEEESGDVPVAPPAGGVAGVAGVAGNAANGGAPHDAPSHPIPGMPDAGPFLR